MANNPRGKLRERQKAETFKLILDSARVLFDEVGFEKTTIRAVAAKAEIGLGTIYKYFSQKNGMLAAAFHDDIYGIMEKGFQSLSNEMTLKEKLLHLAMTYYTFYAARPSLSKTYLTQMFQWDKKWMAKIMQIDAAYLEKIAGLIDDAIKKGEVKEDIDTQIAAMSYFSNYLYVLGAHVSLDTFQAESMIGMLDGFIDLLLSGILKTAQ